MGARNNEIEIDAAGVVLRGAIEVPDGARGVVLFAHGSGSSRYSPRNQMVAQYFREDRLGTLLFDLLTVEEEQIDAVTGELRFDIEFLARRLVAVTNWLLRLRGVETPVGYFGSSTGAAAALVAATRTLHPVGAIVSRGGRPDLASDALVRVRAPTFMN